MSYRQTLEKSLIFYGSELPYHKGKGRIIKRCVERFPYLGKGIRNCSRQDILWELDLECPIQQSIYYIGYWEIWETLFIKSLVREGWSVIDVGANIGYYSLLFGQCVGMKGLVYAFEPSQAVFSKLSRHISMNDMEWIKPYRIGLGDVSGIYSLTSRNTSAWCVQHIISDQDNKCEDNVRVEEVTVMTLDSFVEQERLTRCDFIKVDIEGFEMRFLSGAVSTLTTFKPVLFTELNADALQSQNTSAEEIVSFLKKIGYKVYGINGKNLRPLEHLPNRGEHFNVFAIYD